MATGSVQLAVGRSDAPLPHCDSRGRNRFWIWLARRGTRAPWADWAWAISTIPVLLALLVEIGRSLRRGDFGLDIVAALSMSAALIFGEELAAAIVALMYAGGQYLETDAEGRAQRDMTTLLARAPRTTMRLRDGKLEEIGIDLVAVGDRLLVCQGDVVPVDGTVADGIACSTNRPAEQLIPASPGLLCSGIDSPVRDDLKVG